MGKLLDEYIDLTIGGILLIWWLSFVGFLISWAV
jgi:hypothetical protein